MKLFGIVFFTILLLCSAAFGANSVYIGQASAGANDGTSCANQKAITYFNTIGNWSATPSGIQIGPDTTVHFCGTITTEIAAQGSGSSGHPIVIVWETGAKIQISPGMDSAGVIALGSNNFITLDGGVNQPCGWNTATDISEGSCNGSVKNMLYGSSNGTCPGGTCTTQFSQTGQSLINGTGHDIEIRNLDIGPCYVHTPTGAGATDVSGGCGTITDESGSNWNIHDNKIHDGAWSVNIQFNNGNLSNITVSNNEMYFNSHHFAIDGGNHTISGVTINGNYAHDMYVWDTTADAWHANFVHFFTAAGSGTATNIALYNNIIGGNTGADVTAQFAFSEQFTSFGPIAIFNNLAKPTTSPDAGASNHFWGPSQCDTGCFVYNNTMVRQTTTGSNLDLGFSGTMAATIKNNVMQGASTNVTTPNITLALTFDYNAYGPSTSCWDWKGSFTCTFATWKSQSGGDSHSVFNNSTLTLASNFHPGTGSPLIGAGINVCTDNPSFCTSYPAIKSDLAGVIRPTSSAWDIGAFQFITAKNIYVSQSGAGTADGSSCGNAISLATANSAGTWGAGSTQIGPDTTVHFCGTLSVTANGTILNVQNSGTSGHPITFIWESGATLTSPACAGGSGCIQANGRSFLIFDGNCTAGWDGTSDHSCATPSITNTDNGTPVAKGGTFNNQINTAGIAATPCNNCEFKNLTITNIFRHTSVTDDASTSGVGGGISINGSNWSIHDSYFDQMYIGVDDAYQNGDNNITEYNNTYDHFNWATHIGNNCHPCTLDSTLIHNNHLKNMNNWDTNTDAFHHDGIFVVQNDTLAAITNTMIYNNYSDGDPGTCCATAWVFVNTAINGLYIFNNVFLNPTGHSGGNVQAFEGGFTGDQNYFFYNNTLDCNGMIGFGYGPVSGTTIENNEMNNCSTFLSTSSITGTITVDYNSYSNMPAGTNTFKWPCCGGTDFNGYRSANPTFDVHAITPASANMSSTGVPNAGSPLLHNGTSKFLNLTSLCTGLLSPLCSDIKGNARPNTTFGWDAGAYQGAGAANVYYAQTSAGSNDGSSCANAFAYTDATNGINTLGKWVAGNILHLCGTFTLLSNTTMVTAQASGSSGNPITIKFETGADLKSPFWPSATGAINLNAKSFITVDGGTNGIIEDTANGTGLANQVNSTGIQANGAANAEIKNLTIKNLYVHTSTSDITVDAQQVNCIQFQGSNILIHDNTFTDTGWCLYQNYTNDSGVQIYNNTLTNYAHGLIIAGAAFTQSDIRVYNNHFGSMANWNTTNDQYHLAGIHAYNGSGGKTQNAYIYNNLFDGSLGTCCITGFIFLEGGTGAGSTPWTDTTGTAYLWNNVFIANLDVSNGLVTISRGTNHVVYNNTIIGPNGGNNGVCYNFATQPTNITFENNIVEGCSQLIRAVDATTTMTAIDFNTYGNASGGNPIWQFPTFSSSTLAGWKAVCSCDSHSTASLAGALANLNTTTGVPSSGFAGSNVGTNLTSSATGNLASLSSDSSDGGTRASVARPSSAAWDVGAMEISGAPSQSIAATCSPTTGTSSTSITVTCNNTNTGTIIMCYTLNGTSPVTNGLGTGCSVGTPLSGSSNTISIVVSVPTLNIVAGTSTTTDSTMNSYGQYFINPGGFGRPCGACMVSYNKLQPLKKYPGVGSSSLLTLSSFIF